MKRNFKMSVSLALMGTMILGSLTPVFATVEEKQTTSTNETLSTDVYFNQDSSFTVTIPKLIELDSTKTSTYTVTVEGDIASNEQVNVVPDESFEMKDQATSGVKKANVEATVEQDKTAWVFNEFATIGNGNVEALGLTAGSWRGSFFFNISLDGITQSQPTKDPANFADNSWEEIATACQNNEVPETWNVGDIKTMEVDGVEYEVAIIGKNHDTYADGSGTAPLTFQLVDILNTTYQMNSTDTNAGGWDGSKLYTTLNTTIFETLEADVKNNIKAVSKATNLGGADTNNNATTVETSSDKLFLLARNEVLGNQTVVHAEEGTQYEYYVTEANRIKTTTAGVASVWWLRSPIYSHSNGFNDMCTDGRDNYSSTLASNSYGIAFAFCF